MKYNIFLKLVFITIFFMGSNVYSQVFFVDKTEVLTDKDANRWSPTTENVFLEAINFIPGGSIEITFLGGENILIYKSEITIRKDEKGYTVYKFSPPFKRGTESEIEVFVIDHKPAFALGYVVGWHVSNPQIMDFYKLIFKQTGL
ncbi:hypothetical protein [Flavobacterium humi]|uniref:Uncharacterized protein n=1 Tax=Flavobacterium humi TaxID=2562683 RepID=A0A4Z0L4W0_9FLAO|nr:hypothetical protein [Flavobacterium humi]TGD57511.1 hypothetical protein E4635_09970 [Flavobacterium humi]